MVHVYPDAIMVEHICPQGFVLKVHRVALYAMHMKSALGKQPNFGDIVRAIEIIIGMTTDALYVLLIHNLPLIMTAMFWAELVNVSQLIHKTRILRVQQD